MRAARRIGYPVVVKPLNGNHGRGVSIHLTDRRARSRAAFDVAREHSARVIVESFIEGDDHRLLVVNGELVAATQAHARATSSATARTRSSQLVEIVNQDPRRGVGHEKVLTRLELDDAGRAACWPRRATTRDSRCRAAGEIVYLRSTANLSTGGTATDVTDVIHPDNREMAVRAIRAIGLDVGGVDFLIDRHHRELPRRSAAASARSTPRPASACTWRRARARRATSAGPVIDMLFPPGTPARIPIAAITGTNGKTTTARMLAHIMKMAGYTSGLTTTDGVYIDGQRTVQGDMTGPVSAQMVLRDPHDRHRGARDRARRPAARRAWACRDCDVGAVLNVTVGPPRPEGHRHARAARRGQAHRGRGRDATAPCSTPTTRSCLKMADYTEAKHICYVTMNPQPRAGARAHPRRRPRRARWRRASTAR